MKYLINLFPEQEKNVSERIIYFGFHYLRYILVITQFVAICVFFFRFKIDQEIVDLKDTLYQKQSIVTATSDLVGRVQAIDNQMKQVQGVMTEQDKFQDQYRYLFSRFPSSITISSFSWSAAGIDIQGSSLSVEPIRAFYDSLREDKRFTIIDLSTIEKRGNEFIFTLHVEEFR